MSLKEIVASNIRYHRKRRKLSQEGLAYLSAKGQSTLCHIETGVHSPELRTIELLAKVFEIEPFELLKERKSADGQIKIICESCREYASSEDMRFDSHTLWLCKKCSDRTPHSKRNR